MAAEMATGRVRFAILAMLFCITVVNYQLWEPCHALDSQTLARARPGISATEMDFIFSAFGWSYGIGQIPGGRLLDQIRFQDGYTRRSRKGAARRGGAAHQRSGPLGVVALLGFGRRDVAHGLQEPSVVEPIHPFQGRELDDLELRHGPRPWITFSLVETVDGFGESIVIGISDAADRRLDTSFGQASGYLMDRYWLPLSPWRTSPPRRTGRRHAGPAPAHRARSLQARARGSPAHDPTGIGVDHEGGRRRSRSMSRHR